MHNGQTQHHGVQGFVKLLQSSIYASGTHEPPKAHTTECHHNPNYIITFELNWLLSHVYTVSNNEIVVSLYGNNGL